ncbi:MAG: CopG family ribbon-helix-helix protein [Acidithiobacillus sp.]
MATSIKLDEELKVRVQHLAHLQQRSAHWIMREAISQYVAHAEAREQFKQEALASWQHYQETGLHLTGQEVRSWLQTWGTERETALPPCHE